tara:strand:- start:115 stop:375 length:261 start_codon:yes stop_codon:yes gene_type:complete
LRRSKLELLALESDVFKTQREYLERIIKKYPVLEAVHRVRASPQQPKPPGSGGRGTAAHVHGKWQQMFSKQVGRQAKKQKVVKKKL